MARARVVRTWAVAFGAAAALAAGGAGAQKPAAPSGGAPQSDGKSDAKRAKDPDVPVAYRPPPGMCRIWLADVPPNQQPAPTTCSAAVRNRPSNGRVLFGDDYVSQKSGRTPGAESAALARVPGGALSAWRVRPALNVVGGDVDAPVESRRSAEENVRPPRQSAADEYEAGYAAGYRDAMNGRRPRFRGADRGDAGTGESGYGGSAYTPGGYRPPVDGGYGPGYGQSGTGAVVVVPSGQDPRYFNNGRYPPPGRANGVCLDRDGDGWCDDPRYGGPFCRDLDGDGRCDDYPNLAAAPYPTSLPEMRAGVDVQQGRGSPVALRWLGTGEVVARLVNPKRTGTPYRVLWFDANSNTLLQTWTDLDGDGVADRVEIFRNGRRVKLLGR